MSDPRTFFEDHAPAVLRGRIKLALPDDVVVLFHIQGDGGGTWQVDSRVDPVEIGPVTEGPKDCQIWCSAVDFMGILKGTLDARRAFLGGKLRVVGDVGLAVRLQGVLAPEA